MTPVRLPRELAQTVILSFFNIWVPSFPPNTQLLHRNTEPSEAPCLRYFIQILKAITTHSLRGRRKRSLLQLLSGKKKQVNLKVLRKVIGVFQENCSKKDLRNSSFIPDSSILYLRRGDDSRGSWQPCQGTVFASLLAIQTTASTVALLWLSLLNSKISSTWMFPKQ